MPGEKVFNITIQGPGPWGFRLAGGRDFNTPLYIVKVTPGGKAASHNVLINDSVASINGRETERMTHLEAQNMIKNTTGELSLKIMRGDATMWRPKVVTDSETNRVTGVSLHADKQTFSHPGSKHNATAKPFGAPAPGTATVVHKQFNSPVGIYSSENIADSFKGQTEGMIAGRVESENQPSSQPMSSYSHPAKPYTPTYQEPPKYTHGQASAQYIDTPDGQEMRYSGYQNPGSQSRSFKMLQSMTGEEEDNVAPPPGIRSVKAPVASTSSGGSKPIQTLPMCARCNLGIVGPVLKAKEKTLHPECFICHTCSNSLKNKGFFTVQGKEYCGNCERQARMDASPGQGGGYTNGSSSAGAPYQPAHQQTRPSPQQVTDKTRHPSPTLTPLQQRACISRTRHSSPVRTPLQPRPAMIPTFKSRYQPPTREDPNTIIAKALMKNPEAIKSCQGIVPIFTVDETVKHEISSGPQSPTSPLQSYVYPRQPGAPDDGVKVMFLPSGLTGKPSPSQIASQSRGNPAPYGMSSGQPPRAPGPPPAPSYAKASTRPAPAMAPSHQQHAAPAAGGPGTSGHMPMCDGCDNVIRGPFVSAVGRNWHPEHFVCSHCHENLSTQGFVEQNGKVYCERDFNNLYSPKCAICHKSISQGGCVQAMGNQYHSECFLCHHCKQPITGSSFHISDGKPYCKRDYQALFSVRCAACNYPVEPGDAWVEALQKQWHSNCFTCSNPSCGAPLEGQAFYADRGRPYCQMHAP